MELKTKVCLGVRFYCVLSLTELPFHSTSSVSQEQCDTAPLLQHCWCSGFCGVCVHVCVCVRAWQGAAFQSNNKHGDRSCAVFFCVSVLLCFFVMQAYTLFIFLKKERKKQNPNKPQNHYRKSGSKLYLKKKKKNLCNAGARLDNTPHHSSCFICVCPCMCLKKKRRKEQSLLDKESTEGPERAG